MNRSFIIAAAGTLALALVVYLIVLDLGGGGLKKSSPPVAEEAVPERAVDGVRPRPSAPPLVQEQPATAPEKERMMALTRLDPEVQASGYVPGEHQVAADDPRVHRTDDGKAQYLPMVEMARQLHDDKRHPSEDLEILDAVVGTYRAIYRENPVAGLNHEVTAVLTGENEKSVVLIEPGHPAINAQGELLDRWGTPFRFHGVSSQHMEFLSAGPDGKFGTGDDMALGEDS